MYALDFTPLFFNLETADSRWDLLQHEILGSAGVASHGAFLSSWSSLNSFWSLQKVLSKWGDVFDHRVTPPKASHCCSISKCESEFVIITTSNISMVSFAIHKAFRFTQGAPNICFPFSSCRIHYMSYENLGLYRLNMFDSIDNSFFFWSSFWH